LSLKALVETIVEERGGHAADHPREAATRARMDQQM
jgi:hypothetical protein